MKRIVGAAPGGAPDLFARVVADWLSSAWAIRSLSTTVPAPAATSRLRRWCALPADGHTLFMVTAMNAFSAGLYDNLSFDIVRDIAPVSSVMHGTGVVVVQAGGFPCGRSRS